MNVSFDLGHAAKFTTYEESTNSLKVQNVTLDDVGDYRILLKVGMDESDPNPIKKYFYILVNNQIDIGNKEPGF